MRDHEVRQAELDDSFVLAAGGLGDRSSPGWLLADQWVAAGAGTGEVGGIQPARPDVLELSGEVGLVGEEENATLVPVVGSPRLPGRSIGNARAA